MIHNLFMLITWFLLGVGDKTEQLAKNEGRITTRPEKLTLNFRDYLKSVPVLPADDSWLEKHNFEELVINQPELLRARVRKMFNELQALKKDVQIAEDAQNDFQVRLQKVSTVAHKLRAFENWELSMFGKLLKNVERSLVMKSFLKKLGKDDDHAYVTADNFRTAWGIDTTSNQSLIAKVAEQYSNEISSLVHRIHKWCELHVMEERIMDTKYLDLAINAGLVEIPHVQTGTACEGYTRWAAMFISTRSTEHTPENSNEKYMNISTIGSTKISKNPRQSGKSTAKQIKMETSVVTPNSREEIFAATLAEDSTESSFSTTRNLSKYRLPNW